MITPARQGVPSTQFVDGQQGQSEVEREYAGQFAQSLLSAHAVTTRLLLLGSGGGKGQTARLHDQMSLRFTREIFTTRSQHCRLKNEIIENLSLMVASHSENNIRRKKVPVVSTT
jgi:hypothetical protein